MVEALIDGQVFTTSSSSQLPLLRVPLTACMPMRVEVISAGEP